MQSKKQVIIVGGGFGGIRAALDLARDGAVEVTLISKSDHFEYYPGLHKIVGISNHATYCIPLSRIFKGTKVNLVIDTVINVDLEHKKVLAQRGGYTGDFLILAVGSQTEYFGIQGLRDMSFGFKSVAEAKKLRCHIEELFHDHTKTDKAETVVGLHIVIVGAGPNGVDLAGELAWLGEQLAKKYGIAESFLTIDLIEGASRVLAMMPEEVSHRVEKRLRELGINVLCNRDLQAQGNWTVTLADMTMGAKTLIWTAGVTSNELVTEIKGLTLGKKNRVAVDEWLQPKGFQNVFCIGDIADTQYSGLAQTALYDAEFVTKTIQNKVHGRAFKAYTPKPVAYNIGVGSRWSVLVVGKFVTYGLFAYMMRTIIDIKFFLSILPVQEVWKLYFGKRK